MPSKKNTDAAEPKAPAADVREGSAFTLVDDTLAGQPAEDGCGLEGGTDLVDEYIVEQGVDGVCAIALAKA